MSALPALLRQLEALVQEEIAAQQRQLACLEAQARAVAAGAPAEILERTRALEVELRSGAPRAQRRGLLLRQLGGLWNVSPAALTLSSIVERAGAQGERLGRQRTEMRQNAGRVARLARRVTSAAALHQRLNAEILEELLGGEGGARLACAGALLDAEA
ncbi:MAG TPA: hypothetical protein VMS76_12875 [Planctomycetota bacterium]|nr:hypothetical protein [Planctomycetota bacterium]